MKKSITTFIVLLAIATSFANAPLAKETVKVKTEESTLVWKAYKVTGAHDGTMDIKNGVLEFENSKLVGGSFDIDMTTLEVTDLEGDSKGKLEGHLNSADFFDVSKHKNASLVFTDVKPSGKNAYSVTADLTIKGITKSINFVTAIYGKKANAAIKIDRTEFDIKYGSASFFDGLKDKAIYDEFDIIVDLQF